MTSKRLAARAQFGSLLLAGMLTGSAGAQLPIPATLPFEPAAGVSTLSTAPPSLDYIPISSAVRGQSVEHQRSKQIVNWLGLGRHPQKLIVAAETGLREAGPQRGLQPLAAAAQSAAMPKSSLASVEEAAPACPTRLVAHEEPVAASADRSSGVAQAYSTEPAQPLAPAEFSAPKNDGAVIGGPVPALPLESLLDVDIPDHAKAPAATPTSGRVEMKLSDHTPPTRVDVHETFAPTKPNKPTTSGSFHLSDKQSETPKTAKPAAEKDAPRSPHTVAAVTPAAPINLPDAKHPADSKNLASAKHPVDSKNLADSHSPVDPLKLADATTAGLPEVPAKPPVAATPAKLAHSGSQPETLLPGKGDSNEPNEPSVARPQDRPVAASVASSSSQRPLSLRVGSAKLGAESPTTHVAQQPPVSSYSPVINARPVVRAVKPILPTDSDASDTDVKLCTAQTEPKHERVTQDQPSDKPTSGEAAGDLSLKDAPTGNSSAKAAERSPAPSDKGLNSIPSVAEALTKEFSIDPGMTRELNRRIKQMFPGSRVEVKADEDGLVVDGVAASGAEARKILALVRKTTLCPVADRVIEKR